MISEELLTELKSIYCSTPQLITYDILGINRLIPIDISSCYFKAFRILSNITECLTKNGFGINQNNNLLPSDISEHFQVLNIEYKNQLEKKILDDDKDKIRFLNSIYRLEEIIFWFLRNLYPKIFNEDYDIVFESEINHISPLVFNKKTIDFNNAIFGKQSTRENEEEYIELNNINPKLHLYAITRYSSDIIGALEIYPLAHEFISKLESTDSFDELLTFDSIPNDKILSYEKPGLYSIFVDTIISHSYFRGKYRLIQKLFETFFELFIELASRNIYINEVYAEAWTTQGYELAEFFKMTRIRKTLNGHLFKLSLIPTPDFSKLRLAPRNASILFDIYNKVNSMMYPTVFISYSHKDISYAKNIKEKLESNKFKVLIDQDALKAGMSIDEFIKNSIKCSNITISIVSENSLISAWVAMESAYSIYDESIRDRNYISCYIDKSFLDINFTDKALDAIDTRIKEIDATIINRLSLNRGLEDLQDERTRNIRLKLELPTIISKFRNSYCVDLSDVNFENGIDKIIKDISCTSLQKM